MNLAQPVNPPRVYGRAVAEGPGRLRLESLGAVPIVGKLVTRGAYEGSGSIMERVNAIGLTPTQIGESWQHGYPIYRYEIDEAGEGKPWVYLRGGCQNDANEWVAPWYLAEFVEWLVQGNAPRNREEIAELRASYNFVYVPVVNPNGYLAGTRHNTHSGWDESRPELFVDINRNYSPFWSEYNNATALTHSGKGTAPFSEPETQACKGVFDAYRPSMYLDTHSMGGWKWGGAFWGKQGEHSNDDYYEFVRQALTATFGYKLEYIRTPDLPQSTLYAFEAAPEGVTPVSFVSEPGSVQPVATVMGGGLTTVMYALWAAHTMGRITL